MDWDNLLAHSCAMKMQPLSRLTVRPTATPSTSPVSPVEPPTSSLATSYDVVARLHLPSKVGHAIHGVIPHILLPGRRHGINVDYCELPTSSLPRLHSRLPAAPYFAAMPFSISFSILPVPVCDYQELADTPAPDTVAVAADNNIDSMVPMHTRPTSGRVPLHSGHTTGCARVEFACLDSFGTGHPNHLGMPYSTRHKPARPILPPSCRHGIADTYCASNLSSPPCLRLCQMAVPSLVATYCVVNTSSTAHTHMRPSPRRAPPHQGPVAFYCTCPALGCVPVHHGCATGCGNALFACSGLIGTGHLRCSGMPQSTRHDPAYSLLGPLALYPCMLIYLMQSQSYHSAIVLWYLIYEYFFPSELLLKGEGVRRQGTQAALLEHVRVDRHKWIDRIPLTSDPAQHTRAAGSAERARFASSELCSDAHQHALERWPEIEAGRRKPYRTNKHIEPPCTTGNSIWKRWLREAREASKDQDVFEYIGIPCVHKKYQDAHTEGAKAMIAPLPLNAKGLVVHGPIHNAFIYTAAMLFCIQARYTSMITPLGLVITQGSQLRYYDMSRFSDKNHTGIDKVACYPALIGMAAERAEQWRAWMAAHVETELETYRNSSHVTQLREAQGQAQECSDQDHMLVPQNVSHSSLGYYTAGSRTPRTTHMQYASRIHQPETDNAEVDPPTGAVNNDIHMQHVCTENTNGNASETQIGSGIELEDIGPMGLD